MTPAEFRDLNNRCRPMHEGQYLSGIGISVTLALVPFEVGMQLCDMQLAAFRRAAPQPTKGSKHGS